MLSVIYTGYGFYTNTQTGLLSLLAGLLNLISACCWSGVISHAFVGEWYKDSTILINKSTDAARRAALGCYFSLLAAILIPFGSGF